MTVRVAAVQFELIDGDTIESRRDTMTALLRSIDADLIVLPELWDIGAFAVSENLERAEDLHGEWVSRMSDAADGRTLHAGSFLERDGDRVFNTSVVITPDGDVQATYRKIHLFGFDTGEASVLSSGDQVVVTDTPLGPTALATCYDLRFPELFRAFSSQGAHSVLIPSSWPAVRIPAWRLLAAARAAENQTWVVAANATGQSGDTLLGGNSLIADPWGEVVAQANIEGGVLAIELDPNYPSRVRREFPLLLDRRL